MADTFFFYDLETSGFGASQDRIMQFAGQRTDMQLQPIGEPVDVLIKLTPDVLPSPEAILLTGITPQQTLTDGLTEAEFLSYFYKQVVKPGTIFTGYNSIRFDDEFMRYLHYRNFHDAYEWEWKDGNSRWDILDVVRMTRALRPDGIVWPFNDEGKPANRLEFLTEANKLNHDHAHDALSDVHATIAVAKLIRDKQPDLFEYLLSIRGKKAVAKLVEASQPFVYTSGRYPSDSFHTTAVAVVAKHSKQDAAIVFNLREDPTKYLNMSVDELVTCWRYNTDPEALRLPVKTLKYNRCPAIAPLGVIKDEATQTRLQLPIATITKHMSILKQHQAAFAAKLAEAVTIMDAERSEHQAETPHDIEHVDGLLYDTFISGSDKAAMVAVPKAAPEALADYLEQFRDERLQMLLPLYKARNYPASLSADERQAWDQFCTERVYAGGVSSPLAKYFEKLAELAEGDVTPSQQFLLEELQLYGQAILPADASESDGSGLG